MPKFKGTISGFSLPDGQAFMADENGVFDLPEDFVSGFKTLAEHGVTLEPVVEAAPVEEEHDDDKEEKKRRGRPAKPKEEAAE